MATVGTLTQAADGNFYGKYRDLEGEIDFKIAKASGKRGEKSPDYEVFAIGKAGEVNIGDAWDGQTRAGEVCISIKFADPKRFPDGLNVKAYQDGLPDEYRLTWYPERQGAA